MEDAGAISDIATAACQTLLADDLAICWPQESMGSSKEETDDFKRMLLESNPYLLAITGVSRRGLAFESPDTDQGPGVHFTSILALQVVSVLHMVFDFLAFKNDISFWKNNKRCDAARAPRLTLS